MTNGPARVPKLLALLALGTSTALPASPGWLAAQPCAVPSFAAGVPLPVPAATTWVVPVGVGDVNGDGAPDVALAAPSETAILVFRNDGRGGFASVERLSVETTTFTALLADVDRDGRADIVAVRAMSDTSPFRSSLAVWLSSGNGFLPPPPTEPVLSASSDVPLFADVDGDGRGDLLLFAAPSSPSASPHFSWLRNLGEGRFEAPRAIAAAETFAIRAAADVGGDGHLDLIAAEHDTVASSQLRALPGDGTGGFAVEPVFSGPVFVPVSHLACISRTNLAIVNAGEAGSGSSAFRVDVWDGSTREHLRTVTGLVVPARGFLQLSPLVPPCAPTDRELVVTVTRTSGDAPFLAYAVVNDGERPGEGTGDGAVVGMRIVPTP